MEFSEMYIIFILPNGDTMHTISPVLVRIWVGIKKLTSPNVSQHNKLKNSR